MILSRKEGNKWLRSTQRLYSVDSAEVWEGEADELPANVLLAWMEGTTPIETENPYYLNQGRAGGGMKWGSVDPMGKHGSTNLVIQAYCAGIITEGEPNERMSSTRCRFRWS